MSNTVRSLQPEALWNNFEDLNAVPRPSKREERVIAFMEEFASSLGLKHAKDACGNVIVYKPATPGMENRKKVVLQSHLDMVHQKNNDTVFDFDSEGIRSFIDGDWVTAEGTTLGADNGMGAAAMMTLLASNDIAHPELVALFTIDEEAGMTGAFELDKSLVEGDILLNLDTEDDDEFSIGCAGGIDTNIYKQYEMVSNDSHEVGFAIEIKGLKGGHSGMDIHLGRGNANKILARILYHLKSFDWRMSEFEGGSLRNAIPREGLVWIALTVAQKEVFEEAFYPIALAICNELEATEPNLEINLMEANAPEEVLSHEEGLGLVCAINAVVNGVHRMSDHIPGLVETSSSLAKVILKNGELKIESLQRSSVDSAKYEIAESFASAFQLIGAKVEHTGSYPGWNPNPSSEILGIMTKMYEQKFKEMPKVKACHAGLECGILSEHFPQMDMISFGPTIRFPHSPDEKVNIKSVQKFWDFLTDVLKEIPSKN